MRRNQKVHAGPFLVLSIAGDFRFCNTRRKHRKEVHMIDLTGMISIPYLKKTTFTGSEKGTNFMIRKVSGEEGEPDKIQAITWPGPFIFSVTEDEKKTYHDFEFSEDGIHAAVAWLNEVTHSKE